MGEPLVITIGHKLGKEEALRRVKPALSKASESFPVLKIEEELWSGDRMDFRVRALGQAAAGNVQVTEDNVRLEVTLPWLLQKFGELVQKPSAGAAGSFLRRNRRAIGTGRRTRSAIPTQLAMVMLT